MFEDSKCIKRLEGFSEQKKIIELLLKSKTVYVIIFLQDKISEIVGNVVDVVSRDKFMKNHMLF